MLFRSPRNFTTLSILDTAGGGASTYTFTLNFADATTTVVSGQTAPDWFGGTPFAIQGLGRVTRVASGFVFDGLPTNPRMYELDYTLSLPDSNKTLNSITFTQNSGGVLNIFALSGNTVPEPSTLMLIALGGLSILGWVKHHRRG